MCISGKTFGIKKEPKNETELQKDRNLVVRLYKGSNDKANQIKILSQLYSVSKEEIAKFLKDECHIDDQYIRARLKL